MTDHEPHDPDDDLSSPSDWSDAVDRLGFDDPSGVDHPAPLPESGIGALAPVWARGLTRLVDLFLAFIGGTFAANLLGAISYDDDNVTVESYATYLVAMLGVWAVYEVAGTIGGGRTVGKFLLGLRVRRVEADLPPSPFKALTRWLVMGVAMLLGQLGPFVLGVIYLSALLNPQMQGLHDRAAGTLVVRAR